MTALSFFRALVVFAAAFSILVSCGGATAQTETTQTPALPPAKSSTAKHSAPSKQPTQDEELQQAINDAGNDRAALVKNFEAYLEKYPEAKQRPQIYRALVEANLQLRDTSRASDYAERIVALSPDDISMTLLAIQLLERSGDDAALRRAVSYSTRVLDYLERSSSGEKSPRVSQEEWEVDKKRDKMTILILRGRLNMKLHSTFAAQKDFEASYALQPSAGAAEKLAEIAELNKDLKSAIKEYAIAFALADAPSGSASRHEIRQKLGNTWRLAHGSEDGLGDYMLHIYDEAAFPASANKTKHNATAKEIYEFTLRKAPGGAPFALADTRGKIVVMNFWATWCGPCRALEPHFERVAAEFQNSRDVLFLDVNCDEDEALVAPYLEEEKPRTTVLYADGLDRLLAVTSFPTTIIVDRSGKIAYRADGFDADNAEKDLSVAVNRALASPRDANASMNPSN